MHHQDPNHQFRRKFLPGLVKIRLDLNLVLLDLKCAVQISQKAVDHRIDCTGKDTGSSGVGKSEGIGNPNFLDRNIFFHMLQQNMKQIL